MTAYCFVPCDLGQHLLPLFLLLHFVNPVSWLPQGRKAWHLAAKPRSLLPLRPSQSYLFYQDGLQRCTGRENPLALGTVAQSHFWLHRIFFSPHALTPLPCCAHHPAPHTPQEVICQVGCSLLWLQTPSLSPQWHIPSPPLERGRLLLIREYCKHTQSCRKKIFGDDILHPSSWEDTPPLSRNQES